MNIVYASDDNFVDVMCVSIMSFNDYNTDATIYILNCGIKEHNKQKILELCSEKNTVLFVDAKKVLDGLGYDLNLDRGSVAAYARLFIASMVPADVRRVLYLDSDTLVRGSLAELFNTDISPYAIGGIRDSFSALNKRIFGIKRGGLFVNSGVLLIDLEVWRAKNIEADIYTLLNSGKKVFQGDQGIVNLIFQGDVYELPLKYDVMTYLYDFSYEEMMLYRKPDNYFSKNEVEMAVKNPVIVHFSTSFRSSRPWEAGINQHPYYDEWVARFNRIGGVAKEKSKSSIQGNSSLVLWGIGILHAYLRPLRFLR